MKEIIRTTFEKKLDNIIILICILIGIFLLNFNEKYTENIIVISYVDLVSNIFPNIERYAETSQYANLYDYAKFNYSLIILIVIPIVIYRYYILNIIYFNYNDRKSKYFDENIYAKGYRLNNKQLVIVIAIVIFLLNDYTGWIYMVSSHDDLILLSAFVNYTKIGIVMKTILLSLVLITLISLSLIEIKVRIERYLH